MGDPVLIALQQAADRACRHAVLNSAHALIENTLKQKLTLEMLPWGEAMPMSYLCLEHG